MNAAQLAQFFHSTYENLAPSYGYATRRASAVPWGEVPERNRELMIEVARRALCELTVQNSTDETKGHVSSRPEGEG